MVGVAVGASVAVVCDVFTVAAKVALASVGGVMLVCATGPPFGCPFAASGAPVGVAVATNTSDLLVAAFIDDFAAGVVAGVIVVFADLTLVGVLVAVATATAVGNSVLVGKGVKLGVGCAVGAVVGVSAMVAVGVTNSAAATVGGATVLVMSDATVFDVVNVWLCTLWVSAFWSFAAICTAAADWFCSSV